MILKTIMKPKLFERVISQFSLSLQLEITFHIFLQIHVCQNTSILSNIPKEILPKDYGGDESSLEQLQGEHSKSGLT
jgi:hypothetical protein